MVDVINTSDPLNIDLGNSDLKTLYTISIPYNGECILLYQDITTHYAST